MKSLSGKSALVTGASSGIGHAVSRNLIAQGASVAFVSRNIDQFDLAEFGSRAFSVTADVASDTSVSGAVSAAWTRMGGIDYLVNCAGVVTPSSLKETTADKWRREIDVNLSGAFFVGREAGLRMWERGSGSIVFVGSELSLIGMELFASYCASKAGLLGLTKSMAMELSPRVRVNCVCPGPVQTPMMEGEFAWFGGGDEIRKAAVERVPLKRIASPSEIAEFIVFTLVSATFATGSILSVDGGTTAI